MGVFCLRTFGIIVTAISPTISRIVECEYASVQCGVLQFYVGVKAKQYRAQVYCKYANVDVCNERLAATGSGYNLFYNWDYAVLSCE